jgi:hypothetical protein
MVFVVIGVLVRKFSTTFQTHERPVVFSDFMADVDSGKVEQVTIAGHEITGIDRTDKKGFRTYAPSQYDGLARKLIERGISVTAAEPTQSSLTSLLYSWGCPETGSVTATSLRLRPISAVRSKGNTTRCAGLKNAARRRKNYLRTCRHTRQVLRSSTNRTPAHVRRSNEMSPGVLRSICKKFASS